MSARALLWLLVTGAVVVGVVLVAGGYNVAASAGHLPPVRAVLHLTMRNSVQVRARASAPADLGTDARARAGAVHYDLVCRQCHAAPGEPLNEVARHMVPVPPHITDALPHWQPQDVFWIVKHGIKMTAMPAWPAQARDDEVWSMVAFLERLRGASADDYRRLVASGAASPPPDGATVGAPLQRCARCHGHEGDGVDAWGLPRIDGLTATYLRESLRAYAEGRRASGIMQAQASALARETLDELAQHYAQFPRRAPRTSADASSAAAGERLARQGAPRRLVPACAACHGPAAYPRSARYPLLAGQPASYLENQLRLFRDGARGGTEFAGIMEHAARHLDDDDIHALARYYSTLPANEAAAPGVR